MIIMLIFIYYDYHLMQYLYGHSILSIPDMAPGSVIAAMDTWQGFHHLDRKSRTNLEIKPGN
jgi:hypothetical protein